MENKNNNYSWILIISMLIMGCTSTSSDQNIERVLAAGITMCGGNPDNWQVSWLSKNDQLKIPEHPRLLGTRSNSKWPLITANDNKEPAGNLKVGVLEVDIEVIWGDWRIETDDRTGLLVAALAEKGKVPTIPGPVIRVIEGTSIKVRLHNPLNDSTLTFFGLQSRPIVSLDSVFLKPGESKEVEFEAGNPGTYYYWVKLGKGIHYDYGEEDQLTGAFIVDTKDGPKDDRIFVINIFSTTCDSIVDPEGWLDAMTINGKTWPFTEIQNPSVGDTLRWRVINASQRIHPMHLHGFYFDVTGVGNSDQFTSYDKPDVRKVVTETMDRKTTMDMQWIPSREGKWLFHCHISYHVDVSERLPGAELMDDPDSHLHHMSGLVVGLDVKKGTSDLISKGEPKNIQLYANESDTVEGFKYRFSLANGEPSKPGPPLILKQYQPTFVNVKNNLTVPTSIHWHGLELNSWADGVPGWSASGGKSSPEILPGQDFTYELSLMRKGTFIYHTHLDDIYQLTQGLYGPIIVIGEDEIFNPEYDHIYLIGEKGSEGPKSINDIDVNGLLEQPELTIKLNTSHRIRLINICREGIVEISITKNEKDFLLKYLAKDGAELPINQQVMVAKSPRFGVGETADFEFIPSESGEYEFEIIYYEGHSQNRFDQTVKQKWIVSK